MLFKVEQNPEEEEDWYIKLEIIKASRQDDYVRRVWFKCYLCKHPLNSAMRRFNQCPYECGEGCRAKRGLSSEDLAKI